MRLRTVIAASTALACSMFLLPQCGSPTRVTAAGTVGAAALQPSIDNLAEMAPARQIGADRAEAAAAWYAGVSATTTTTTSPTTTSVIRADNTGADATPSEQPQPDPTPPPSDGSVVEDAIRQFFSDIFTQAWNVSGCESTHDPSAVSAGGGNWGLFQINYVHADEFQAVTGQPFHDGALDPYANAKYARHLYDESGGWGPWACRWAA